MAQRDDKQTFVEMLRGLMKEKKATAVKLAAVFGKSPNTVYGWVGPKDELLPRACEMPQLWQQLQDFMDGKGEPMADKVIVDGTNGLVLAVKKETTALEDTIDVIVKRRSTIAYLIDQMQAELDKLKAEDKELEITVNTLRRISSR